MSPEAGDWPEYQSPSRLAIVQAIPGGSKRARSQRGYLRAVVADPVIAGLRADRRRAVLELARILARHANWRDMTSWRPRALACAEIGSPRDPSRPLSVTAYRAARRVLEDRGFLGLVAQGWTSALGPAALDDRSGTSAVFILTIPRRRRRRPAAAEASPVNRALTDLRRRSVKAPRAREASLKTGAGTRSAALETAQDLQRRAPVLARISAECVRSIARPFTAAGWSTADVAEALNHSPDGRQHGFTAGVRHPAGWFRSRLAAWLAPDGTVRPSAGQVRAAAADRVRQEQAARRAAEAAVACSAAPPERVAAHAAAARRMLRARRSAGQALRAAVEGD